MFLSLGLTAQKMKFSINDFLSKCDQITFTEGIPNGKLHFCAVSFVDKDNARILRPANLEATLHPSRHFEWFGVI